MENESEKDTKEGTSEGDTSIDVLIWGVTLWGANWGGADAPAETEPKEGG